MHTNVLTPILCVVACVLPSEAVRAEFVLIPASADATLYESEDGSSANGGGAGLFAGMTAQNRLRRALLRFDLSAVVPDHATITSASLTLYMSRSITGTEEVSLHRALASWSEGPSVAPGEGGNGAPAEAGDATWLHRSYATESWATPGGDFDPAATASALVVGIGAYTWSSSQLTDDVRRWAGGTLENHGWFILGNEGAKTTAKRFNSREHEEADTRPALRVEYVVPSTGVFPSSIVMTASFLVRKRRVRGV